MLTSLDTGQNHYAFGHSTLGGGTRKTRNCNIKITRTIARKGKSYHQCKKTTYCEAAKTDCVNADNAAMMFRTISFNDCNLQD